MEWKHPRSLQLKIFKMGESVGKGMVMVLLDCKGVLLVDFMAKSITINAASYCATLEWLQAAIK